MPAAANAATSGGASVLNRHWRSTNPGKRSPSSATTIAPTSPATAPQRSMPSFSQSARRSRA
jgi:hypothetical protein